MKVCISLPHQHGDTDFHHCFYTAIMRKILTFAACCLWVLLPIHAQQCTVLSAKLDARAALLVSAPVQEREDSAVHVYITFADETAKTRIEQQYHVHFNVGCGDTYTAVIPRSMVADLAADSAVKGLSMGEAVKPMTDEVRLQTQVDTLHTGTDLSMSYKGAGVLVGIIDTGFDFTHPHFADAAGRCRILSVWDQNAPTTSLSTYGYGSVYDTPAAIAAAGHDNTLMTHGTHVAGIAAGSAATPYQGMAPESKLVLVSTNRTEQGIVDGVDYLVKYAQQAGRPIAINISLGSMLGFKDGTGLMARMIDHLLKDRQGCLMAVAVGNEGHRNSTLTGSKVKSIWKMPASGADQLFVEARPSETCTVRLLLKDKKTNQVYFDHTFATGKVWTEKYERFGTMDKERASLVATCGSNSITGAFALTFHVGYTLQPDEEWTVELRSSQGTAMAYSNNGNFSAEGHEGYTDGSARSTIAMTATGREPIAVGATVSKNRYMSIAGVETIKPWTLRERYPLSALGPCSDGRIKPDIVAPGAAVVSSYNSFAAPKTVKATDVVYSRQIGGKPYYWYVESGTSMAAPAVTGIMALWLQAHPTLTAAKVRTLLSKTARREMLMGQLSDNRYGMGQIDALAGMQELLGTTGVASSPSTSTIGYVYKKDAGMLFTQGVHHTFVYGVDGQLLLQTDQCHVHMGGLPTGLYFVRLKGTNGEQTVKLQR